MKAKFLTEYNNRFEKTLTEALNELAGNEIVDIKLSSTLDQYDNILISAIILYK